MQLRSLEYVVQVVRLRSNGNGFQSGNGLVEKHVRRCPTLEIQADLTQATCLNSTAVVLEIAFWHVQQWRLTLMRTSPFYRRSWLNAREGSMRPTPRCASRT